MPDKLNIAVIGCGKIAQTHLEAIRQIKELNLVAVADINAPAAEQAAQHFGGKPYADYRAMIDREELQIACVCTPPLYHPEVSLYALSSGLHVLCEKPFAIDSASAIQMINKAAERQRLIVMASKFRFVDDIAKAKGIIDAGILGEIVLFEITFCNRVNVENNWPSNKEVSGGGVLIDNGTHAVDIARFLVGPIARVQMQAGKQLQKIDVEDTAMLFFETRSGVWGRVDLSWSIHKDTDYYINIFGSRGMLSIGWKHSRYRQNEKNEWVTFGTGYDKTKAFVTQLRHFIACVQNRTKPIIDSVDSFESVKVIEMAYESSKSNKWLDVR